MSDWWNQNKARLAEIGLTADRVSLGEIWAQEDRERKAFEQEMIANAKADAQAVWVLADYFLPSTIKEDAVRWNMESTLTEMWRGAFVAGWRAAKK